MPENFVDPFEELLAGLTSKELIDGLTIHELSLRSGKNVKWIRDQLHLIAAADRLIVGRKKAMDIKTGRMSMQPCYKVTPAPAAKKK